MSKQQPHNPLDLSQKQANLDNIKRSKSSNQPPLNHPQANKFKLTNNKLVKSTPSKSDITTNSTDVNKSNRFPGNNNATMNHRAASGVPNNPLLNPMINQQAALAALSASIFNQQQSTQPQSQEQRVNNQNGSNLMSLFNNPQLFMAMAAAASSMNSSVNAPNGKKSTAPLNAASNLSALKYSMSNSNLNNNN